MNALNMDVECFRWSKTFPKHHLPLIHLRKKHSLCDNNIIICNPKNCCRMFSNFNSFRKHLKKFHSVNNLKKDEPVDNTYIETVYDDESVPVMINNNYDCSFNPVSSIPIWFNKKNINS